METNIHDIGYYQKMSVEEIENKIQTSIVGMLLIVCV